MCMKRGSETKSKLTSTPKFMGFAYNYGEESNCKVYGNIEKIDTHKASIIAFRTLNESLLCLGI